MTLPAYINPSKMPFCNSTENKQEEHSKDKTNYQY